VTLDTELEAQERSPWQQALQPKYITKLIMIVIIAISTGDVKKKTQSLGEPLLSLGKPQRATASSKSQKSSVSSSARAQDAISRNGALWGGKPENA
jgi:hypothetical protein